MKQDISLPHKNQWECIGYVPVFVDTDFEAVFCNKKKDIYIIIYKHFWSAVQDFSTGAERGKYERITESCENVWKRITELRETALRNSFWFVFSILPTSLRVLAGHCVCVWVFFLVCWSSTSSSCFSSSSPSSSLFPSVRLFYSLFVLLKKPNSKYCRGTEAH